MIRLVGMAGLLSALLVVGCGDPPRMPARASAEEKKEGVKWDLMLADPLQEQAPATHVPVERWRTHHLEYLNNGLISQDQCMTCHQPEEYCNKCHSYVGVMRIVDTRTKAAATQTAQAERTSP